MPYTLCPVPRDMPNFAGASLAAFDSKSWRRTSP
jgi:hypothetical protein